MPFLAPVPPTGPILLRSPMLCLLILDRDALPDAAALAALRARAPGLRIHLRIDAAETPGPALALAPDGVAAPVAGPGDLARLANRLAVHEAEAGLPDGATGIVGLIGSAACVLGAAALAGASPRLAGLAWDAEALAADLGIALDRSAAWPAPLAQARGQVVLAARVAGVPAFETVRRDSASLAGTAEAARLDGFAGIAVRDPAEAALVAAQPPL